MKHKVKRFFSSIAPIAKKRTGKCIQCGKCCQLPNKCIFQEYLPDGKSKCIIYKIRPLSCRKYPRTESEFLTIDSCGFRFEGKD